MFYLAIIVLQCCMPFLFFAHGPKWLGDHSDYTPIISSTKPPLAVSVYCLRCWLIAALSAFTVVELQHYYPNRVDSRVLRISLWCAFSLLLSSAPDQHPANWTFLPSSFQSLLQSPTAGKNNAWTECSLFISTVLYFQHFPPCILLRLKAVHNICLFTRHQSPELLSFN